MTENVENQEVVEQTEAAPVEESKESAPPSDETPKPEEKEIKEEVEERKLTQKEVDEAIQKRLARESRKLERQIRAEMENKFLRQQLEAQSRQSQPTQPSGEPKPEQFKTYEEYIDKLTDYKLDQRLSKVQEQSAQHRQAQDRNSYEDQIRENLSKGASKYDDFEEAIDSIPANYMTEAMAHAIGESESAADIAYYLGNNHKEAASIAKLTPVQQIKAIDRLEAKLKSPPKVTKAPAPLETTGKGRSKSEPDLESMSVAEYAAYRAKNGARWSRH